MLILSQVTAELAEIKAALAEDSSVGWLTLLTPAIRPALFLGMMLQIIQQFAGINTAMYYRYSRLKCSSFLACVFFLHSNDRERHNNRRGNVSLA